MPLPLAIAGAAVIGAGASIYAGSKASKAQKQAAQTAAASADRADVTNRYIFDTTRADYAPWRAVGAGALGKLADMYGVSTGVTDMVGGEGSAPGTRMPVSTVGGSRYGGFEVSPGYQFRIDEAIKAIERSAAARGGLRSGATMDAIQRRVQGEASNEYERYTARLMQLAGLGENANSGSANAGANYASGTMQTAAMSGNAALAAGNARASGYVNTGNAINQGIQNVAQAYLYNRGFGGSTPVSGWGVPGSY